MTLKYPSTGGYGMSAPSAQTNVMNKLAAANNASAGTSSWKMPAAQAFPTLKGATGNTLYPAPKAYPSVSSYPSAKPATSYPSVSAFTGKLTAPSSSSFPTLKGATGNTLYPAPKTSSYPSLTLPNRPSGGILGSSGQSFSPASGGQSPSAFFQSMSMPQGFSSAALGGSAPQAQTLPPAAAAPRAPQATPVRATTPAPGQGYGMTSPTAAKSINQQAAQNNAQNKLIQQYGGPPKGNGVYATKEEAAYHAGAWNQDGSYGKADLKYGAVPDGSGGWRVGDAPSTAQQRPRPPVAAPPVIVGRPTQTGQPVSIPVNRQPTQDEIDAANQGGWLS